MLNPVVSCLSKVVTMADHGVRVQFDCNEMTPEQLTDLIRLKGSSGWLFFQEHLPKKDEIAELELPKITLDKKEKSPSERMRAVFFLIWQKEQSPMQFDLWYRIKMDDMIETLKEKLD